MRLISTCPTELSELRIEEFYGDDVPSYAILSHRWGSPAQELTFQDFIQGSKRHTSGFRKIKWSCRLARQLGLDWVWVDTCCIDKTSSAELSESINSMYNWYKDARYCFVFLETLKVGLKELPSFPMNALHPDDRARNDLAQASMESEDILLDNPMPISEQDPLYHPLIALSKSNWFERGWTLQELLAGERVFFFDRYMKFLGSREDLAPQIADRTSIDVQYLQGPIHLQDACVAQKISWASHRHTKRPEDLAYSLMGLLNVNMPLLYGEGLEKAFFRLQVQVIGQSVDDSIFAWRTSPHTRVYGSKALLGFHWPSGLLATRPKDFQHSRGVRWSSTNTSLISNFYTIKRNVEFELRGATLQYGRLYGRTELELSCTNREQSSEAPVRLLLTKVSSTLNTFVRRDSGAFGAPVTRWYREGLPYFLFESLFFWSGATSRVSVQATSDLDGSHYVLGALNVFELKGLIRAYTIGLFLQTAIEILPADWRLPVVIWALYSTAQVMTSPANLDQLAFILGVFLKGTYRWLPDRFVDTLLSICAIYLFCIFAMT